MHNGSELLGFLPVYFQAPDDAESINRCRIVHWRHDEIGRVRVYDRKGRLAVDLSDYNAERNKDWKPQDLDGDGTPEVLIYTWTGGAHASFGYYLISLARHPRCLLAYWKGNGGDPEDSLIPKDLNHDGKKELVTWYDGFAYLLGAGYAPVPVPTVLELNGGRFVEATPKYRGYLRQEARESLCQLDDDRKSSWPARIRCDAVEFLSNKILLGEEESGWTVLRKKLSKPRFAELFQHREWIQEVLANRKYRCKYPSGRVIRAQHWKERYREVEWKS